MIHVHLIKIFKVFIYIYNTILFQKKYKTCDLLFLKVLYYCMYIHFIKFIKYKSGKFKSTLNSNILMDQQVILL